MATLLEESEQFGVDVSPVCIKPERAYADPLISEPNRNIHLILCNRIEKNSFNALTLMASCRRS
jgi:hypothetical protein